MNRNVFFLQQTVTARLSVTNQLLSVGQLVFLCARIVLVIRCCGTALQVKTILWAIQNKNEHNHKFSRYLNEII